MNDKIIIDKQVKSTKSVNLELREKKFIDTF